jgi:hypothetical protein
MKTFLALGALMLVVPAIRTAPEPRDERSKKVDEAIRKALVFLAKSQNPDGTWSAGGQGKHPAISGLAVMAFLSAGHVPGEGKYGTVVEKGIRAVMKLQHASGLFASDGGHEMYHHGICTLMMAEVVGMTQGPLAQEVKKSLEKALAITLVAQRKGTSPNDPYRGGWRYRVSGIDSDMSVTGWQVMTLRAAKNVGCDVPPEVIDKAVDYLKRSQNAYTGAFCYTPNGGATVPCTGPGILALAVCGKGARQTPEAVKGGTFLMKHPPHWGGHHFFYSIYYCSQAMFQLGGNYWDWFRPKLHDVLLKNQNQTTGSWFGSDGYGPSYSTAMGVLSLTVEYRFLPIYQRGEEPTDKK